MLQSIMTSRGQITIPAEIRDKLGLVSGNKLEFLIRDDQIVMLPINKNIRNLKGILPKPDITLSCEDMNEIIRNVDR
jgi:antitoxin PrlF